MDFAALYKSKLTTPEEAVKVVKSGDWVDYGAKAKTEAMDVKLEDIEKNKEICRLCAGGVHGREFAGKRSGGDGVGGRTDRNGSCRYS